MKDCLIRQLKGTFENQGLPIYGVVEIEVNHVDSESPSTLQFNFITSDGSGKTISAEIIGDGAFYQGTSFNNKVSIGKTLPETSNTDTSATMTFVSNPASGKSYKIRIYGKYNINTMNAVGAMSINLDDFKFSNITKYYGNHAAMSGDIAVLKNQSRTSIFINENNNITNCIGVNGDIAELAENTHVTSIAVTRTSVTGNIASLASMSQLQQLIMVNCPGIYGDIKTLGVLENLTVLNIIPLTNVEGKVEELIDALRTHTASGSISDCQIWGNSKVTVLGQPIPKNYYSGNHALSWDASGFTFNGTTYNYPV